MDEAVKMQVVDAVLSTPFFDSHSELYADAVVERLYTLGYDVTMDDVTLLTFSIASAESSVKAFCNLKELPAELDIVVVDRACGEFLYMKRQSGQLDDWDAEQALSQVKLGDATVALKADASPSQRRDAMIADLRMSGRSELVCYRRLKW